MEEKVGRIYCIINKVNGKLYIGQTVQTIAGRFAGHIYNATRSKSNALISKAINKYNKDNFIVCKIWEGDVNILDDKEIYYIKLFDSKVPNGYNLTEGGGGNRGYTPSKESVKKQVLSRSWYKHSEETKQKISISNTGKIMSEEAKEKVRLKALGRPCKEETKNKLRQITTGIKRSEECRRKHSEQQKGRYMSPETRKKLSEAHIGKKASEELRAKFRLINSGERNPHYGKHHSLEAKQKQSECKKDKTVYKFIHPIYGIEECTQYELRTKYSLTQTCVSDLCNKKQKCHKKWRLYYE